MNELRYPVSIRWSDEDAAYVAAAPDLPGCIAHGDTYDAAVAEIQAAMRLWLRVAREHGDLVPAPATAHAA